jgi:luciferase-type oxidoreductase
MDRFNRACVAVLAAGRMTIGLMTPAARPSGGMADLDAERQLAERADMLGFAALWARDVPLMVPQGADHEVSAQDDPFVWLATLSAATQRIALGTAAAVLPLRNPLHLAKSALSLDRLSGGRFILGLGSGDRPEEFVAFGEDVNRRAEKFRAQWPVLRSALGRRTSERELLLEVTHGYELMKPSSTRVPMIVVGSARQSLQWIAANADAWATYHRDEVRQQGRIGLWRSALRERAGGKVKPFVQSVQSVHLDLLASPDAPSTPVELGLRTGRRQLIAYLARMEKIGVSHVMLHLAPGLRPVLEIVDEIGQEVLPALKAATHLQQQKEIA